MSQRLIAACVALPLVIGLLLYAAFAPLPYATYAPGGTLNVLGEDENDAEVVQVLGHGVYRDDGDLRMTTVSVSPPKADIGLLRLMSTWVDSDDAVYPYGAVHDDTETPESSRATGALQMSTSQDDAIEVAMSELGIDVPTVLVVGQVSPGQPAAKVLEVGDQLVSVDGTGVTDDKQLRRLINAGDEGEALEVGIRRDGRDKTVQITPATVDGRQLIGITPGYDYDFPFEVKINISDNIGGPSAGLMFSLAVYDTLSKGSLTGGRKIAGTGEIAPDGSVGPIGGIQQKIAGAREQGVDLFLVPPDNCADALKADAGDMRLMRAETMHDARVALEAYAQDPDTDLPSCEDAS